jgi:hypothetical protein
LSQRHAHKSAISTRNRQSLHWEMIWFLMLTCWSNADQPTGTLTTSRTPSTPTTMVVGRRDANQQIEAIRQLEWQMLASLERVQISMEKLQRLQQRMSSGFARCSHLNAADPTTPAATVGRSRRHSQKNSTNSTNTTRSAATVRRSRRHLRKNYRNSTNSSNSMNSMKTTTPTATVRRLRRHSQKKLRIQPVQRICVQSVLSFSVFIRSMIGQMQLHIILC